MIRFDLVLNVSISCVHFCDNWDLACVSAAIFAGTMIVVSNNHHRDLLKSKTRVSLQEVSE